jgi:hypothetical protein
MRPSLLEPIDAIRSRERTLVAGPPTHVPMGRPPHRARALIAVVSVIALVVTAGLISFQQMRLNDAEASLATSRAAVIAGNREVAALEVRLERAEEFRAAEVAGLERRAAGQGERLRAARTELRAATALLGPPIADGTYQARLMMVGASQAPPMAAFDRVRIFFGDAAAAAALADGTDPADVPDDPGDVYYRYIRNVDPTWRIVPIAPDALVVLQSWRFQKQSGYQAVEVPLRRFGRIYNGTAEWNHHLRWQHYTVSVVSGEIVAIEELNLSP